MATARRPNILRLCLVIVLVLCIGIGVWQGVLFIQSQGQPAASVSGGTMVALPFSSDTPYEPFGEGFVYLSDQGLHCIDPAGQELWQQTIADLAGLSVSQSAIVCYRGNTAMLLGADGALLSQVDCTDPIAFARIGRGRIAACTQPDGAARLVIADYAGNILDTLDYGAGELMDCGFDGQDNLWTLTMAASGSRPVSRLTTYRSDEAELAIVGDVIVEDQVVYRVDCQKNATTLVGTQDVLRYGGDGKKQGSWLVYGWVLEDTDNYDGSALLLAPQREAGASLSVLRLLRPDQRDTTYNLASKYTQAFLAPSDLVAVSTDSVYLIPRGGGDKREVALPGTIDRALRLTHQRYLICELDGRVLLYALPLSK
ncbi:MAG: DUF5711 family protein [Christensenellales bacterium]|jgi:hypothetical protein